ncbi:MAG: UxaA family hydrolase [Gammaproteobacteria bacterium]|nr:UxaA family hydrolase [Gammaproteobacteria bacterium]
MSPAGDSPQILDFAGAARVPASGDNVAIATRRLEAGQSIRHGDALIRLPHVVMEGHRFVLEPIAAGQDLLSWGLPFGRARRDLMPGEYVCNDKILAALAERNVDFELPAQANFSDFMQRYELDEHRFEAGRQVAPYPSPGTFMGYAREPGRGVGTRNFIIVLGTTSRSSGFARALAARFENAPRQYPNLDGVVAVTHTEGGGRHAPNNLDMVLRTLCGFMTHPNVAAAIAVDHGDEVIDNDLLERSLREGGYPIQGMPHAMFRIGADFESELDRAGAILERWLPDVGAHKRSEQPLSALRVALQCGGSDAFSGISGNALAGWVAKEIIRHGGGANLAETDELIGAEPYVLSNVADLHTARRFLEKIDVFKQRAERHGASAEGNPSGGNNYRGLYNIALKSIGAARKKDPEVRLDCVLDYAQPMGDSGYYFMDSPGNDLESIAGQVASGCNLIFFITGNGSITNFPFVPTLKFVTTTGRFQMLANEMDVNAGRYNDGMEMADLGRETFELAREIASGRRSKGELAGHAQVQLWRNWQQTEDGHVESIRSASKPDGRPLATRDAAPLPLSYQAWRTERGHANDQIALVMPTSLCSGQVASLIADTLNAQRPVEQRSAATVSRFVALPHTEGCGSANADDLYLQTLLGHLTHPFTRYGVLLEHGCEKTHNDAVRHYLAARGVSLDHYGWASVQLDGGIARVKDKVAQWFAQAIERGGSARRERVDASALRLGLVSDASPGADTARTLATLAAGVVAAGGTVVVASNDPLLQSAAFTEQLLAEPAAWRDTLGYGEAALAPGLHVMSAPTEDTGETLTGLGGTGVELVIAHICRAPIHSHPMVPVLQICDDGAISSRFERDLDLMLSDAAAADQALSRLTDRIAEVCEGDYVPRLHKRKNTQFQLTRGLLGVSL